MPAEFLYWISSVSAVLDNASLAAAGVSPALNPLQLKAFLLGLSLAGGMLIPGNFPNIVCAAKLRISMKEWAKEGLPLGLALMILVFIVWKILA
jgi:predicted cation transporter